MGCGAPRYSVAMKRMSTTILLILVLVIVIAVVVANLPEQTTGGPPTGGDPAAVEIARPAGATLSHIAYVHDGDTLYLQPDGTTSRADEITVRLIGIDTPELRPEVQCYAVKARDYLRQQLPEGTEVWVESDRERLDRYGRTLLYLWKQDGTSVNLDLVEKGYASALTIPPNDSYHGEFEAAERAARAADRGQWGSC